MNGISVNRCSSLDCAVFQYREEARGNLHVGFLPLEPHIDDNSNVLNVKITSICGTENEDRKDVINVDFRRAE
jgi:hypothetical protein